MLINILGVMWNNPIKSYKKTFNVTFSSQIQLKMQVSNIQITTFQLPELYESLSYLKVQVE